MDQGTKAKPALEQTEDGSQKERVDLLSKSKDQAQMAATTGLSVVQVALLKELLDQRDHPTVFHCPALVMVSVSLALQVIVGALALLVSHLRSYYSSHKDDPCQNFFQELMCCGRRSHSESNLNTGLFRDSQERFQDFRQSYQDLLQKQKEAGVQSSPNDIEDDVDAPRDGATSLAVPLLVRETGATPSGSKVPEDSIDEGSKKRPDSKTVTSIEQQILVENDMDYGARASIPRQRSGFADLEQEEENIKVEVRVFQKIPDEEEDFMKCGCFTPMVKACCGEEETGFFEQFYESLERCKFRVYKNGLALNFYNKMVKRAEKTIRNTKDDPNRRLQHAQALRIKKDAEDNRSRYFKMMHRWERLQAAIEVDYRRLEKQKNLRTLNLISMWQQIINYCLYFVSILNIFIAGIGITQSPAAIIIDGAAFDNTTVTASPTG